MARQRHGYADAARGAAYTVHNNPWPYLVPPVAAVANLILSGVLSRLWGAYAQPTVWEVAWRSALILTCSALIVWATWAVGRARKTELRVASMLMSAGSCAGLFVLTFRGWSFDSVMVYLIVMTCACILLALTKLLRGDGTDARANLFGELGERVRELQDVGKTGRPKTIDGRIVTHTEMLPGADFGALAKPEVRTAIASALDVPAGGVRMVPNRNTPRLGRMEVSPVDMLENPPAWPGLSAPGGSIADPIRIMVYQTGKPVPFYLPGDQAAGRNAVGVLILLGQSGSGKTELQITLAAEARSRRDARVIYIDGRKGLQLPEALRRNVHVFIHRADEGERYLDGLVDAVARRAGQIGAHGHEQWTAGCGLCPAFDLVIVDEASKFIEAEETLVELAESVRSVGICLVLGIQRATGDRLPTSVRSTIGGVICMGVKDVGEGARVLSEETIAAGADPGWKNTKPGALYAELPGTDPDDWSLPARTFKPDRDRVLDELVGYLDTIGQAGGSPAAEVSAERLPVPNGEGELVTDTDDPDDADDTDDPECPPLPIDPDCLPDPDPHTPISVPNRPRIELALDPRDGQQFTPSEIREIFRQAIIDARAAGVRQVKPSSFAPIVDIVGEDGLKPPTISKILGELCTPGPTQLLRKAADRGVYEIITVTPQPHLVGASTT
ncbi:hypothetical protein O7626_29500 [Micromonospora sp. WMMD1102]|uniref:ATP-binding protein n=1 Tax=Micromonospora sp. WMMD1102 TaxID=3016105 RepID=UPI002414D094|nr:hypothetical protein [Micromonospora sp. WMMD1102]MDG4790010.1 hypothetical protein [Micromonospora sp. WMMD1102]